MQFHKQEESKKQNTDAVFQKLIGVMYLFVELLRPGDSEGPCGLQTKLPSVTRLPL